MPRHKAYSDEKVLEKAMQVFWDHGYEATSVRLLEKEMGINQFSIYSSFANKKKLFVESLKKYREYVKNNSFHPLLKSNASLKDLEDFFQNFSRQVRKGETHKGCLIVNTAAEFGSKDPEVTAELQNYFSFIRDMMKKVLVNAVQAGEIPADKDPEKYSNYLLGIMQGLSVGAKVLPEKQIHDIISVTFTTLK